MRWAIVLPLIFVCCGPEDVSSVGPEDDGSSSGEIEYRFSSSSPAETRVEMLQTLFGQSTLPRHRNYEVIADVKDTEHGEIRGVGQVDQMTISLGYEMTSVAYMLHPAESARNELIIYHQGHELSPVAGSRTVEAFLDERYTVFFFSMPLLGANKTDQGRLAFGEAIRLTTWHASLIPFEDEGVVDPIRFFVEPVIIGLNYVQEEYGFATISMVGHSGGGWTTALAAAIDPRIERSYTVAGGLPFELRQHPQHDHLGDFEQLEERRIYSVARYVDWYLLGAWGDGRRQLQILNRNDNCCFWTRGLQDEVFGYRDAVREQGGDFEVVIDVHDGGHAVSDHAHLIILKDLNYR